MNSALETAKYVIDKCTRENHPVSNMQLQKILYYIQREFLQMGREAFPEEFEAWQIGAVVPEVYNQYCGFGATPIRMRYNIQINWDERQIIDFIVEGKRILRSWDLARDVQSLGGAWDLTYRNGYGDHQVIPKKIIKRQPEKLVNEKKEKGLV